MKNQFSLEISNPCSENFNQFAPTSNGGFCGSCQKEVIDFSKMNSEEIMNYFKNKNNQNTCGKFKTNQLKTYTKTLHKRRKYSFWSSVGLTCLAIFSFNTAQAQTEVVRQNASKTITKQQEKNIRVKGVVSDDTNVLPGVNILLQGTTIGTVTNFDGYFEFPKPLKNGDVLVFSYIGLESQKVVINNSNSASNIKLKVDMRSISIVILGKVAVKKVYKSQQ